MPLSDIYIMKILCRHGKFKDTKKTIRFIHSVSISAPILYLVFWYLKVLPVVSKYRISFGIPSYVDYCSVIWNNGYLEDLCLLEGVQWHWTKSITGLDNLSYHDRLRRLKLFSVQGRLLKSELIQYWKILNNKSCILPDKPFKHILKHEDIC